MTELDRTRLLLSLMPEKCFTLGRDVFLCWANIQSIGSLRNMADFTDNSYLLRAGPVGANKWCKVESETVSLLQSMSSIYR